MRKTQRAKPAIQITADNKPPMIQNRRNAIFRMKLRMDTAPKTTMDWAA